jgi:hypothetical protein
MAAQLGVDICVGDLPMHEGVPADQRIPPAFFFPDADERRI